MGEDRSKAKRTGEMRATEEEAVDALRAILRRAVERHEAEAILLSGGLDTSILALLAHERGSAQKAVTVVLDGAYAPDLTYARKVAQRFQLEHHVIRLPEADALGTLPEVIAVLRSFDPALPNDLVIYTALKEAKKLGITSVMTGDGADELFAGYTYLFDLSTDDLSRYIQNIAGMMQFSSNKLGAALGLEIQQPYCDSALVDFALALKPELKVRERAGIVYGKWLVRRAFEAELGEIAWRAKDPIEVGSGTAQLRSVIRSRISDAAFEAKKRAYKLAFMNKEHLYFYELYRAVVGELPEPGRDAESVCPLCKVELPAAQLHCDRCGFSQPIERYLGKDTGRGESERSQKYLLARLAYTKVPAAMVRTMCLHPLAYEHLKKVLDTKEIVGADESCEYYPCHYTGQDCTWCFCPFYPCEDEEPGGRWVEREDGSRVWGCSTCFWIHQPEVAAEVLAECIASGILSVADLEQQPEEVKRIFERIKQRYPPTPER